MRRIKIISAFFLIAITAGCSIDDDNNTRFFFEAVPIEEVDIPDRLTRGETVTITTSYFRPSTCHGFSGYDFNRSGNQRTFAIINVVLEDGPDCEDIEPETLVEESFDFLVGLESSYIFRFWQGKDDEGNNQFLVIEVPVDL
ncbi:hypothetical protein D1816_15570 [Aquimarina sp. AD10]|uniref:Proteinase inhibitor I42 chagasin domain-containing protein n=1 Tax=Aquimarina aggregata TaxID=1642818 RepID=A0A162FCR7_9FLAO|nr:MULTISPECIES: hypothetical protein [Aquimarina]AXT61714.1 hypothetical protein D1816_15570 [Aquimarina sp. AD10]KZS41316.1 hypothetical protein AWE51_21670 [Aquimarina aggregata]RKN00937.1 hypothetical protein D7033_06195 [Aquimarina sp. AD10]